MAWGEGACMYDGGRGKDVAASSPTMQALGWLWGMFPLANIRDVTNVAGTTTMRGWDRIQGGGADLAAERTKTPASVLRALFWFLWLFSPIPFAFCRMVPISNLLRGFYVCCQSSSSNTTSGQKEYYATNS
ncbi:hypothetical protein ACRALDRAFT_2038784 [Sodiomyces alcalophilus JCM 7366]|uniref:uncharacterized protein n=1 Tax=Sodiomyces alcalophilus JCM 7366 TaxID=591952 RepID=UPI0039B67FAB